MSTELQYNRFLIFGDSITEFSYNPYPLGYQHVQFGFGAALQNGELDIIQRGYAGYTSEWAKHFLEKIIQHENKPDSRILLGTIFFGTNDSVLGGPQKVELPKFLENIKHFIDTFKANGIKPIIIGVGKYDGDKWEPSRQEDINVLGIRRTNENNKRYSEATKELAAREQVPFVDLYSIFDNYEGDWHDLLLDGVHYTGEGYRLLFDELLRLIKEWYPEYHPENLPYILPYWRDLATSGGFN
ncbi:Isoamyl acetate-hydrolyzing esterase 1 [Wickerhamomyces ciferrii]|uniref:Isoamyl acetate-hydrolyzing esterase 1 n=1 Tax=Wickerhamomyces ciferrii (strain ATCC 14091 / BCRC 22168 / CBS 111 / JCM 3599 / NBRC 0793 / NRRL Y-1031 F-60-10) TaxID=1206466 RepID=K0KUJ4_WICCF|nr:Isoamyl acetate-hydrolyzing esterase 1 [Wickerhamomyces ciferrii]CCH46841.1 Isoamyl acetate-hydrolyzing esterase 1 [Wickerhamomyces ciferrii]